MPQRWTKASNLARVVALVAATPAFSGSLPADGHLNVIPRTAEEIARIEAVTRPTDDFSTPEQFELLPAGAATSLAPVTEQSFTHPSANMNLARRLDFVAGHSLFEKIWVQAPTVTRASDGLGPLYNARGCQNCHIRNGRGHLPEGPDDNAVSFVMALAVLAETDPDTAEIEDYVARDPEPTYGRQIQDFAAAGLPAEAQIRIDWDEVDVPLAGGEVVTLRKPIYSLTGLAYGPLREDVMMSPRIAPQMVGLGLLEAIPEADILSNVDEDDADGDGISGRANFEYSPEHGRVMLGRFGRKASSVTVMHESAAAFSTDVGISNMLFPAAAGDCTPAQAECLAAPQGDDEIHDGLEINVAGMEALAFHARNLAVPARRAPDAPEVLRGKQVFYEAGCVACHTPKFVTHRLADRPEQSFQLIWPYTDMLLHDMGDGLADGYVEGRATGREWRTAPLWGIGLTETVSGVAAYLHDGRARSLLEAVLWHGGEARASRDAIVARPKPDRDALVAFLESL
ncbi:thiol oxidoreductase [Maritimibacter sp. DP4N28-5]|uniref:Thiol oxidoreductase n=2 Tax=Maritimibacter dapengensis TaxID=2836868 RepID=A0ABS6T415_9RHOB|nr:thiol oxidoreductase [Maritimibacter dapengensis]